MFLLNGLQQRFGSQCRGHGNPHAQAIYIVVQSVLFPREEEQMSDSLEMFDVPSDDAPPAVYPIEGH